MMAVVVVMTVVGDCGCDGLVAVVSSWWSDVAVGGLYGLKNSAHLDLDLALTLQCLRACGFRVGSLPGLRDGSSGRVGG